MKTQPSALYLLRVTIISGLFLLLIGCESAKLPVQPWPDGPANGRLIETPNYRLYTTVGDPKLRELILDTLGRSHATYENFAPVPAGDDKADAFVFAYREEWAQHTKQRLGNRASLYLNISRGGFMTDGWFSTFYSGSVAKLLAIVRHEGFHQHVNRGFKSPMPPFLEEGLATLFEEGFEEGNPRQPIPSFDRLSRLREAVKRSRVWPLDKLLRMHAGHVVGANDYRQVRTFYAQAWAFADYLSRYHGPGLRRLLAAYADGSAPQDPRRALASYLDMSFEELSAKYEAHVRTITRTN